MRNKMASAVFSVLVVLAVNSYVTNGNCSGVTYSNRIDTYALDLINSFLP